MGPGSTGLTNLQNWLKGTAKGGASSLPTYSGTYYSAIPARRPRSSRASPLGMERLSPPQPSLRLTTPCAGSSTVLIRGEQLDRDDLDYRHFFLRGLAGALLRQPTTTPYCSTVSGSLNPPGSSGMCSATQTYNAILTWLTQTNDPFPQQLRAGRVKYYGAIPTAITGSWPSYGGTDQRFWVEFIDYMLGYRQTSAGVYYGHQRHGRLRQRFHLGDRQPQCACRFGAALHELIRTTPCVPCCAAGSGPWS